MILTYHDGACIKAAIGDTTLVFGPVSKSAKRFKPVNFGADIAFVSLNHPDMNGGEDAGRGDKQPFVVSGPGEYEIGGISAVGFASHSAWDRGDRINTVYSVHLDGMSLLYLGAMSGALPREVLEMDAPDIVIAPVWGEEWTLDAAQAQKIVVSLEPKIVIPVLYDDVSLKKFLKEASADGTKPVDKLTIKPKDVSGKEGEVVVLSV